MSDGRYSEILGLNAETIWFGSLFAIQTILSGFKEWELDQICHGNGDITGDFARRVSFYHEKTLIPVMQSVKNNHKPPSFAVTVLKNISSNSRRQIFDLHAKLLLAASKMLIECYSDNFGRSVTTEVERWFAVLEDAIRAFAPFTSNETITELHQVVEDYETKKESIGIEISSISSSCEEGLFFCHEFLFIRIAYMVEFYVNPTAKMKKQATGYTFLAVGNDQRRSWGTFSGNLIQRLFRQDVCGLCVLDKEMNAEGYIEECINEGKFKFPMIDYLPYGELASTLRNRGHLSLPNVLQESVLCRMFGSIRSKYIRKTRQSNGDRQQLKQLETIFSVAVHTTEKELHTIQNREKVRKCQKKKMTQSRIRRKRKQGPDIFIWDTFVMGSNSYFYQFRDFNGTALREFYKKCNARGQLLCETNV